jgi:hypothetical protein
MFGPTHYLRELSAVIAASSVTEPRPWTIGQTPPDPEGKSYPICAVPGPNGTWLDHFTGRPVQPSPGYIPRPPPDMDPAFRMRGMGREGFDRIKGCEYAAHLIFMEICERHGEPEARRIFAMYQPPSDSQLAEIKNQGLLDVVDSMVIALFPENRLTLYGAAKYLAKQNETLPQEERWGPSGTKEIKIMHQHIKRLRDERDLSRGWCDWRPKPKRGKKPKCDIISSAK